GSPDRLVIAVAHREIIFDDAAQRGQREKMGNHRGAVLTSDVEHQPTAGNAQVEGKWSVRIAGRKKIVLQEIVDGDCPLMFDIAIGAADRALIPIDGDPMTLRLRMRLARHQSGTMLPTVCHSGARPERSEGREPFRFASRRPGMTCSSD